MVTYSTKEAAAALGVYMEGVGSISQMISSGKLPATKVGRRWVIEGADLEAAVQDRAGVRVLSEGLAKIAALEEEAQQLRQAIGSPHTPAAKERRRVIRAEWELEHGQRKRGHISKRTRWLIFERDGHRCVYCGARPSDEVRLVIDHRTAVIDGGSDDPDNLCTACEDCNDGKRDSPLVDD